MGGGRRGGGGGRGGRPAGRAGLGPLVTACAPAASAGASVPTRLESVRPIRAFIGSQIPLPERVHAPWPGYHGGCAGGPTAVPGGACGGRTESRTRALRT